MVEFHFTQKETSQSIIAIDDLITYIQMFRHFAFIFIPALQREDNTRFHEIVFPGGI